jgi:ketosteroid isomerase-like protein
MKCKYILLAALSIFIIHQSFKTIDPGPDPVTVVKKAMDSQVTAWNSQDLEKAMRVYRNSPEMLWINKGGISKGYQPILEEYKKEYTDKSKMGTYSYESLHIEEISPRAVYFVIHWKIELNGKRLMGGISSLLWKKTDGNWVITSEHAS